MQTALDAPRVAAMRRITCEAQGLPRVLNNFFSLPHDGSEIEVSIGGYDFAKRQMRIFQMLDSQSTDATGLFLHKLAEFVTEFFAARALKPL